jgi:hypothetical protein
MGVTTTTNSKATYVPLFKNTLLSSASSVTFGASGTIPQTYTDLVLVCQTKQSSSSSYSQIQVGNYSANSGVDTGTNYSMTALYGTGSSATSDRQTGRTAFYPFFDFIESTSNFTTSITHFMNYSNSSTYKTFLVRGNDAGQGTEALVALWRSTNNINIITISSNNTFAAGSTFTLYGITAA